MGAEHGDAMTTIKLASSSSAPALGAQKGVSIMIDTAAPMREIIADEIDPSSPQVSLSQAHHKHGKAAWTGSSSSSPSRPGSRCGAKLNNRESSMSSVQRNISGRFSYDELLCFKKGRAATCGSTAQKLRLQLPSMVHPGSAGVSMSGHDGVELEPPTPSSSCEPKRDGCGDPVRTLRLENCHSLPVLKSSDSTTFLSSSQVRFPQTPSKRQKQQQQVPKVENLPEEELTATLLDRIYPKTPTAAFKEMASDGSDISPPFSPPATPQADTLTEPLTMTHASSTMNYGSSLSSIAPGSPGGGNNPEKQKREILLDFRKQLLDRFKTIQEGFRFFEPEVPAGREMTKKEWRRILNKLGFVATVDERDAIFQQLDINENNHVSMLEFHIALEAAVPIRSMEDLRRRWLASNVPSMSHALSMMDDGGVYSNKRLTLREFGEVLSRVHVVDPTEHYALFNLIADANDRQAKVTVGELGSAIATVSPATYLEEVRHKLLKRYGGSAKKCFQDFDTNHSNVLSRQEFRSRAVYKLGLTEMEAEKMFRTIDFDNNGSITLAEFLCALSMSEPNLFNEDLRKLIRQRFRSIRDAFAVALEEKNNVDLLQNPKLDFERFQVLLKDMDMNEEELSSLFDLIDANRSGFLTIKEFVQGVQYFAPSCVLEDLRLHCLQQSCHVGDAFAAVPIDRSEPLGMNAFRDMLESKHLTSDVDVDRVFLLLDVRNEGVVTIGKLVAALQSGGPGSHIRLPSEERDQRATGDVKNCLMPTHRFIGDLKMQVRMGHRLTEEEGAKTMGLSRRSSNDISKSETQESTTSPEHRPATSATEHRPNTTGHSSSSSLGTKTQMSHTSGGHRRARHPAAQKRVTSPIVHKRPTGMQVVARAMGQAWSASKKDGKKSNPGSPTANNQANAGKDPETEEEEVRMSHCKVAPRLRALPPEELAKYVAKLDQSRVTEHRSTQDPVAGAQKSWGRVWHCFHQTPQHDQKDRAPLEKELLTYFQTTATKMSHDVPLLERSHSRHAILRSVNAHIKALEQNKVPKS